MKGYENDYSYENDYGYEYNNGVHRCHLWTTPGGEHLFAEAESIERLQADPRLIGLGGQISMLRRKAREAAERLQKWACLPNRRVYGPGLTQDEAEEKHVKFLRSGWSRYGCYHSVSSESV